MWTCKHCQNEFDFTTISQKANHSRWCESNPKRNDPESKKKWSAAHDMKYGSLKSFSVTCECCSTEFTVDERELSFPSKNEYFCSRSCANSKGGQAKADKYHQDSDATYTTVAWRHHKKECLVCGFDFIVEAHHVDCDHENNDPKNLVPLCPNHHKMVHTNRYKHDIEVHIARYLERG